MRTPVPLSPAVVDRAAAIIENPPSLSLYRRAVSLILRDKFGLEAARIAEVTGLSYSFVRQFHARAVKEGVAVLAEIPTGGRRRSNLTLEQERALLEPFLQGAHDGRILEVGPIHRALERRLGRDVPASTVYRLLARHGWRKVAPRPRHPQASPEAQEAWKKNSTRSSPATPKKLRRKDAGPD